MTAADATVAGIPPDHPKTHAAMERAAPKRFVAVLLFRLSEQLARDPDQVDLVPDFSPLRRAADDGKHAVLLRKRQGSEVN
jgi:hypothetical protein